MGAENIGTECELFNLKEDPQQTKNVINENREIASKMQKELLRYIFEGRSRFFKN